MTSSILNANPNLHGVIMAGGVGTRFWPLSRRTLPKQFLALGGDRSLIQEAFQRVQPWIPNERTWVVTNARFADQTRAHLPAVPPAHILQEPCGRNTAPCVGLAALCLSAADPDAVMLVMPADHIISPPERFQQDVARAVGLVQQDPERLVLFGVTPSYPATGFGYIERGEPLGQGCFFVSSFREKPQRETAESYIRAGTFFWNCGIFVWRAKRILDLLKAYEPSIADALESLRPHLNQPTWTSALAELFPRMKSISIDYAVLEREQNIAVLEATYDWDDVGSWEAMTRLLTQDDSGNTVLGKFVGIDTSGCIIHSADDHLVAAIGLKDCVIVHTPSATLVANRDDDEGMRSLIKRMEELGMEDLL